MNERIKQIAEQAGVAVWGDAVYMYNPKDTLDLAVLEKFAELIVQKCANLFEIEYGTSEVSGNEVARVLKQHFGVE